MKEEINNLKEYILFFEAFSNSSVFIYIRENLEATARGVIFFHN